MISYLGRYLLFINSFVFCYFLSVSQWYAFFISQINSVKIILFLGGDYMNKESKGARVVIKGLVTVVLIALIAIFSGITVYW